MFYRSLIKLIEQINRPLVHRFAYLYTFLFCRLCLLISVKSQLPHSPENVMGLCFANPIGLAAGFDRKGKILPYSEFMGFGSVEVGTINIEPNYQAADVIKNLEEATKYYQGCHKQQWGINLGCLRETLDAYAVTDYAQGMALFWKYADYLVINLSRPRSPVRESKPNLNEMSCFFNNIKQRHRQLVCTYDRYVPMVIKIAVDYDNNQAIPTILQLIEDDDFDGVILSFENWPKNNDVIDYIYMLKAQIKLLPFIVVGGIRTMTDAKQVLNAGASLVQVYTSLVQYGPWHTRKAIFGLQ